MFKRTRELPKPPIEVDSTIPKLLSDISVKCLQIDPALRYQTAREIRADLEAWRGGATHSGASVVARRPLGFFSAAEEVDCSGSCRLIGSARGRLDAARAIVFFSTVAASHQRLLRSRLRSCLFAMLREIKSLDWLGSSLAETLSTDVGQSAHLRVVPSERVSQIIGDLHLAADTSFDPATIQRLAGLSNSDNLVWGHYARFGDQIRIDATIQDLKHDRTASLTASATESNILGAIDHLAGDIRANLALSKSFVKELQGQSFKPSTSSIPALRDYDQGLQLERRGNHLDAIKQFQASTQEDPNFALAYSELSRTYAQLGQDSDAEQASRKAVALGDQLPTQEKYLIEAGHYQILRDYPKAIEAYENLAKVAPDNTDVLFSLGLLYENSSAYDSARDEFSKVLKLDPKRVAGLLEIGKVEIESGNAQKGLEYLAQAQAMAIESGNDEERAEILQAMGGGYASLNKHDDAIRNYQDSLAIKTKLGLKKGIADSMQAIATSQAALGRPELALKNYTGALDLRRQIGDKAGTGDALNDLAQFYDDRGQFDKALELFKESLQIEIDVGNESNQGLVLNNIGNTYLYKADYQNARTYFEQALQVREKLKVSSDIADTLHNLAETLGNMAQYDQALQYYVRALDLRRSAGDKLAAAIESSSMGTMFGYQGRFGAALSSEEDAVKAVRELQEHGFWLAQILGTYGHALSEVGRFDDAQKNLDEAISVAREQKNEGQIAEVLGYLGDNAFYRGDFKSAGALYDQALEAASHATDAHLVLMSKLNAAKVAVMQGHFPAASASLRALSQQADKMGLKYASVECSIYLADAAIGMKNYAAAKTALQDALNNSDKLGLQSLLAQSHFLLGRATELSGDAAESKGHYRDARQIADSIQKEAHTDAITKRSDLGPIYAHVS